MQFGIALNIPGEEGRSDAEVIREHLSLGDLAEPLGFDSLFVLEHHFTSYLLSPAPFELLAFYAGRTNSITLGTAVVVLPWHDPIHVAEEIALLDVLCDGRCLFAFGRGRAELEFKGFRVPMSEARARFREAAEIVVRALSENEFGYDGRFYRIPALSIRPKPVSMPQKRFYGAGMSSESAKAIARLGFGMLVSTQKAWTALADDLTHFKREALAAGYTPKSPIVLAVASVARTRVEAHDRAFEYLGREWEMIDSHYRFSDGSLANIKGYESYKGTQDYFARLTEQSFHQEATANYMTQQLIGTPDECISQIMELTRLTGLEHLVLEFSYGGMPISEAQDNMKLFASEVMPAIRFGQSY